MVKFWAAGAVFFVVIALPTAADEVIKPGLDPGVWFEADPQYIGYRAIRDRLVRDAGLTDPADASLWPTYGRYLYNIPDGGWARRLEIEVGDVLTQIDGQAVKSAEDFDRLRKPANRAGMQAWTLVRLGERPIEVEVPLHQISLGFSRHPRRQTAWYINAGTRDQKWDGWMIAAAEARYRKETELVGPMLVCAVAAGYEPDGFSDALLFDALVDLGRWREAGEIMPIILPDTEATPFGARPFARYAAARAAGRWAEMVGVLRGWPDGFGDANLAEHERWLASHGLDRLPGGELPADLAEKAKPTKRINGELELFRGTVHGDQPMGLLNELRQDRPFLAKQQPGRFRQALVRYEKPLGDFEVTARFRFQPAGPPHFKWPNALTMNLIDVSKAEAMAEDARVYWRGPHVVLGVGIASSGKPTSDPTDVNVRVNGLSGYYGWRSPWLAGDGETLHTVRMIRVGSVGQVLIDGRTVLLAPLDPAIADIAVHLHVVGYEVNFESFDVVSLNHVEMPAGLVRHEPGTPFAIGWGLTQHSE